MSTTQDYMEYVCEQIRGTGDIRYKKMFGEYMAYVNDKPVLLICDNTVYVKKLACIADLMSNAEVGIPYTNASEYYILDIENAPLAKETVTRLEAVIPIPKPKPKKKPKPEPST